MKNKSLLYEEIYSNNSSFDGVPPNMLCPRTHVRNPRTRRCNKICKRGFQRNSKFKCRKMKKKDNTATPILEDIYPKNSYEKYKEVCPYTHERNPYTRRCNKKCKQGFQRNSIFKCRKKKKGHTITPTTRDGSNINSLFSARHI